MFEYFTANNLISPNQSGFRPGDPCIDQLLSIIHEIYQSFENGFDLRGMFLDISKESLFFLIYINYLSDIYSRILNYLLTTRLLFQFYMTKISQPKTLMKIYKNYVSGRNRHQQKMSCNPYIHIVSKQQQGTGIQQFAKML